MSDYRYIVTFKPDHQRPFVREVTVDGPQPLEAVKRATDRLRTEDEGPTFWQSSDLAINVERVQ